MVNKILLLYPVILPTELDSINPKTSIKKQWNKLILETKNLNQSYNEFGIKIVEATRYKSKFLKLNLDINLIKYNKKVSKEYKKYSS